MAERGSNVQNQRSDPNPPGTHATRFTLTELMALMFCSAITCVLIANGLITIGVLFLLTIVAFRTSLVDFTPIGSLAVLLTMLFGLLSIAAIVLWSAGW